MKKQLVLIAILASSIAVFAQKEYKVAKNSGHLILNLSGAIIEGHTGNEIIFSIPKTENEVVDERAKGLRIINGSGFTDNTGLGLDVAEKGNEILVNAVGKTKSGILTIKVPRNVKVSFKNSSNQYHSDVTFRNLKNEIEVSTSFNKIKLENNSGPMNIKALYGAVDAVFSGEIKGPVSIVSVYGYVDVALPSATKADIELSTSYGKLYAADGLKIALEKNTNEKPAEQTTGPGTFAYSGNVRDVKITTITSGFKGDTIKGKINGGGANLILKSNFQNVYLRDK